MKWLQWVAVVACAFVGVAMAQQQDGENVAKYAAAIQEDTLQYKKQLKKLQQEVEKAKLQADMAEAEARRQEALWRAEGGFRDKGDGKGVSLEDLDIRELRLRMGLPPDGPVIPDTPRQAQPPQRAQVPELVSVAGRVATFRIGGGRVNATPGTQLNSEYTYHGIENGQVVVRDSRGNDLPMSVSW